MWWSLQPTVRETSPARSTLLAASDRARAPDLVALEAVALVAWVALVGLVAVPVVVLALGPALAEGPGATA
eukprot:COSAG02_NODE_20111_length_848_cov_0.861148_2_plen_71_part_00